MKLVIVLEVRHAGPSRKWTFRCPLRVKLPNVGRLIRTSFQSEGRHTFSNVVDQWLVQPIHVPFLWMLGMSTLFFVVTIVVTPARRSKRLPKMLIMVTGATQNKRFPCRVHFFRGAQPLSHTSSFQSWTICFAMGKKDKAGEMGSQRTACHVAHMLGWDLRMCRSTDFVSNPCECWVKCQIVAFWHTAHTALFWSGKKTAIALKPAIKCILRLQASFRFRVIMFFSGKFLKMQYFQPTIIGKVGLSVKGTIIFLMEQ